VKGEDEIESQGRVLVTGARGFVGRAVLKALQGFEPGREVFATHSLGSDAGSGANVVWQEINLLNTQAVRELLAQVRPSHLIHLAWAPGRGIYESAENARWAAAGSDLLDAFVAGGGQRAVFAGTCAEYDWNAASDDGVFSEAAPLGGGGAYGEAKRTLQLDLDCRVGAGELSGAWARIFFLFGPHEPAGRLVPAVIGALLDGAAAETTHGEQIRDYLYVRDAADAIVNLLASDLEGPVNIGSGEGIRLKELILDIARRIGGEHLARLGALAAPEGEVASVVADTTRLTVELGWRSAYERGSAVAETIDWWRSQRRHGDTTV